MKKRVWMLLLRLKGVSTKTFRVRATTSVSKGVSTGIISIVRGARCRAGGDGEIVCTS